MLEWFVVLALVAGIASLLGHAGVAVGIVAVAKISLIVSAIVGVGLLAALFVQGAQERRRNVHG